MGERSVLARPLVAPPRTNVIFIQTELSSPNRSILSMHKDTTFSSPLLVEGRKWQGGHIGKLLEADALSRCDSESSSDDTAALHAISGPSFSLIDDIRAATSTDSEAAQH